MTNTDDYLASTRRRLISSTIGSRAVVIETVSSPDPTEGYCRYRVRTSAAGISAAGISAAEDPVHVRAEPGHTISIYSEVLAIRPTGESASRTDVQLDDGRVLRRHQMVYTLVVSIDYESEISHYHPHYPPIGQRLRVHGARLVGADRPVDRHSTYLLGDRVPPLSDRARAAAEGRAQRRRERQRQTEHDEIRRYVSAVDQGGAP